MMVKAVETTTHEPWCTEHVHEDEFVAVGWCEASTTVHGVRVGILSNVDDLSGASGIEVFSDDDNALTAMQACEVARVLLDMAEKLVVGPRGS